MQHIVERLIDGLPVYLREDYPKFVELLRAYYTWQSRPGKFLDGVYGHEATIDIDRAGLERVMLEMDEGDIPVEHRRSFAMFSHAFNSSRGSLASFDNYFRIFHDAPVRVTNSARYVFMPSAAVRERYHRAIVESATPLPTSGVLRQAFGGGVADVVAANCIAIRDTWTYEVVVVLRNTSFYPGDAVLSYGTDVYAVTFVPFADFASVAGNGYEIGDKVEVTTDLMTFLGTVKALEPIQVEAVTIDYGGAGYEIGNIVSIPGARGFRGEVAKVDASGTIEEIRVIDIGDPFGGLPFFHIASSGPVFPAQLSYSGISGRPLVIDFALHPFGVVTGLEITSKGGVDAAFLQTPRLFHETWIPRGYNGVIGIGSTITDSAAYMDSSYIVSTPVDADQWTGKVKKLLHPAGRYMHAVKTAGGPTALPDIVGTVSEIVPFEFLAWTGYTGQTGTAVTLTLSPPPVPISLLLDTGEATRSLDLVITRHFSANLGDGQSSSARMVTPAALVTTLGNGQSLHATLTS